MKEKTEKHVDFGTVGIIIGILVAVLSVVWVTVSMTRSDEMSGDGITWVG